MMKISTLSVVAATCIASTLCTQAQTKESPWTFGVKAGANIANTSNKNESGRTGFNVGGTVEYKLANRFFLQSGLEFTTKGSKANYSYIDYPLFPTLPESKYPDDYSKFTGKSKVSQNLMMLQIPLTVGYRLPISKDINLTFNAGAYMALGVGARSKYNTKGILTNPDGTTEPYQYKATYKGYDKTGLEHFDYGLLGGIGIEYQKFSLNVNYELGLRNLNPTSGTYLYNSYDNGYDNPPTSSKQYNVPKWKNRNITISLGYKF